MLPLRTLPASILTLTIPLMAQAPIAVELEDGEVIVGSVLDVTDAHVKLNVEFPGPGARKLQRDRIRDRSLFAILASRVDAESAEELYELANEAAKMGLERHAIAALRAAERLQGDKENSRYGSAIKRHRESIAKRIVESAKSDMELGNVASARVGARFVAETFGSTKASDAAEKLLGDLEREQEGAPDAKLVDGDRIREVLESTQAKLKDAESQELFSSKDSVSLESSHRERLETAIAFLEKLWNSLSQTLPAAEVAEDIRETYRTTRHEVRDMLADHYLAMGRMYVQVGALPEAAALNEKACALDSDHKGCARLQRMIVMARLEGGTLR